MSLKPPPAISPAMKHHPPLTPALVLAIVVALAASGADPHPTAATPASPATPPAAAGSPTNTWPAHPLTLNECLDLALNSPAIQKARQDVEEAHGVSIQQRSVYLPRLRSTGAYSQVDTAKIEKVQFAPGAPAVAFASPGSWTANIAVVQPIFAGGRLRSSARSSKLTREAALAGYQSLVADTLLSVNIAYQDILLAAEQIIVQEASIHLLEQELSDTHRRFDAGTVPRFNVLRAEVELANAKPRLIRARNAHRIAKNNLAVLLGFNIPRGAESDIPLQTADHMAADPFDLPLGDAINRALGQRHELVVLRTNEKLRAEEIRQSKADYFPQLSGIAGYGWQSRNFDRDLTHDLNGWNVGAQLNWDIWDAGLTQGRVMAARAREARARIDTGDTGRRIELEVRTAHSNFNEAHEVLDSQAKVIEQAEEALRLATVRGDAGTGTQLDVLSAQTALTETRTTYSVALHDYSVARARLARAVGDGVRILPPTTR